MASFGDLRSVLHNAPSEEVWEAVCHTLSEMRGTDIEGVVVPYALAHLTGWPDELRRAPLRWKDALARGARLPFTSVVRVLDLTGEGLRNEDMLTPVSYTHLTLPTTPYV